MLDIYIAIFIIIILSSFLFYTAFRLAKKYSRKISIIITVCVLLLLSLSIICSPHYWLESLLPFSNLLIFSNPNMLFASFIAGTAFRLIPGKKYRKFLLIIPLLTITFYSSYNFLFKAPPTTGNRWKDGVCLQSSESSCSAACAATLLKHYGISTTEKEMVDLCLTRKNGTTLLGTYRGLKIKTRNTEYSVKMEKWSLDKLLNTKFPVIIQAELKEGAKADPRYAGQWGWTPGVSHAVIFYGRGNGNKVIIADPSVGRENWRIKGIKTLWHGQVLFIDKSN